MPRTDNQHQQPSLGDVIQTAIDANLINLHVCLPAKIVSYDSSTQVATVLPSLLKLNEDSDIAYPWLPIANVPVIWPRGLSGQAYIHIPLITGDDVTLLICERSLDNWKETGLISDPDDRRKFNITDCFAFPGGSASPLAFKVDDPQSITIKNTLSTVQISPAGQFAFKGVSGEVLDVIITFMQEVAAAFTATSLGPQPLINATDPGFVTVIAKLTAMKKG